MIGLAVLACTGSPDPEPQPEPEPLTAADYCEATVDVFCPFYLRCGWTATDEASCESVFLETCNAVYEPRWTALEDAGLLALDEDGIAACAAFLETATCDSLQNELQGPCARIWAGQVEAGGSCGLGLESFVCDDASTCVLGLDFCGTCQPTAPDGESCDTETRCQRESACVDGTCVARSFLGEPCSEDLPCLVGADCVQGTCMDDERVGVGDDCGVGVDCPYTSTCVGGTCVEDALLGEDCAAAACASGWCDGSTCQPRKAEGEPCDAPNQCTTGVCDETCGPAISTCITGG